MKIIIMGYARHGKDTVAEILRDRYGLTFKSSSYAGARLAVYPALKPLLGYQTIEQCYADRVNHRALWHELIKAYNYRDRARLARLVLSKFDVYVGMRSAEEFEAAKEAGLFDVAVWVDAHRRLPPEPVGSCTVNPGMADLILDNNGSLADLEEAVGLLAKIIL